jgi:ABC-type Mn2+/Zn2+ transport system ATPase subunit
MRLDEVSFRYGRRADWVLFGVTVGIDGGETVVVRGRNGAGKSTLLQLIAGVLRPTRGRILDRPARVGWVPERFPAEQPFTVSGYLSAMAAVTGSGSPEPWIERLGLAPFRTVRLGELSKGTAQKVGLAQALIADPDLLVLDEPWEGLDASARDLVPDIVSEVVAAGGAVLVSDHRGETARLPGATEWTVEDGRVAAGRTVAAASWLIEVAAGDGAAAVASLRAAGHQIIRVRAPAGAVPEAPGDEMPDAPVGAVPGGPGGPVPEAPGGAVPEAPGGAVPEAPGGPVPGGPGGAVPEASGGAEPREIRA